MIWLNKEKHMKRLFDRKTLLALAGLATFVAGFAYAAGHPCLECIAERDRCIASGGGPICYAQYKTCWQENGCRPTNPPSAAH
ncbi:MAG: hypothetical protein ACREP7_09870 [Lysobacter sp.]